jgi:hypothetical protein
LPGVEQQAHRERSGAVPRGEPRQLKGIGVASGGAPRGRDRGAKADPARNRHVVRRVVLDRLAVRVGEQLDLLAEDRLQFGLAAGDLPLRLGRVDPGKDRVGDRVAADFHPGAPQPADLRPTHHQVVGQRRAHRRRDGLRSFESTGPVQY